MNFNLFLWPMLIPMILPLFYCIKFKKESMKDIFYIIIIMILIVVFYWPLTSSNLFSDFTYIFVKYLLFFILPIIFLLIVKHDKSILNLKKFGIKKQRLKKTIILCIFFLPIMLITSFLVKYFNGVTNDPELILGTISFFESFTEEFFFRGILFIYLLSITNLKIAYITSFASFVLMHPQHFENYSNLFFISTIVQAILTTEIARRSENIAGSWLLHGTNRFFQIVLIPLIL